MRLRTADHTRALADTAVRMLQGRPWTAAVLIASAGAELAYLPLRRPSLMAFQALGGATSLLIAAALLATAAAALARPSRTRGCGMAAMLLGLASCPMANWGGFLIGCSPRFWAEHWP